MAGMKDVYEFFRHGAEVATFATVDRCGHPHVQPLAAIDLVDGKICFLADRRQMVCQEIEAHPEVELCGVRQGTWWRLHAKMAVDASLGVKRSLVDVRPALAKHFDIHDRSCVALIIEHARGERSSVEGVPAAEASW